MNPDSQSGCLCNRPVGVPVCGYVPRCASPAALCMHVTAVTCCQCHTAHAEANMRSTVVLCDHPYPSGTSHMDACALPGSCYPRRHGCLLAPAHLGWRAKMQSALPGHGLGSCSPQPWSQTVSAPGHSSVSCILPLCVLDMRLIGAKWLTCMTGLQQLLDDAAALQVNRC